MTTGNVRDIYTRGIYFHSDCDTFSYAATCLADGLDQLGVPVYANISYADRLVTGFEFEQAQDRKVRDQSFCVVVDLQKCRNYCSQIVRFEPLHERMCLLCMQDEVDSFCSEGDHVQLTAHGNRYWRLPGNRVPIGFGLSSAMIEKTADITGDTGRQETILHSFRPSLNQSVRACLDLALVPRLSQFIPVRKVITQAAGRWNDEYYRLLRKSFACLAYGGTFVQDLSENSFFMQDDQIRRFLGCIVKFKDTVILRWDSWRFWESLVSACLTIHLDFDEYGFELPQMPENWRHYVGLRLSDIPSGIERMMDERSRLGEIAWNGRQWAIEYYSPVAVGRRFIELFTKNDDEMLQNPIAD